MEGVSQYSPLIPRPDPATQTAGTGLATEHAPPEEAATIDAPLATALDPDARGDGADAVGDDAGTLSEDELTQEMREMREAAGREARRHVASISSESSYHTALGEEPGPREFDDAPQRADAGMRGANGDPAGRGGADRATVNVNYAPVIVYHGPHNANQVHLNLVNRPVIRLGGAEQPRPPNAPHRHAAPREQAGPADVPAPGEEVRIPLLADVQGAAAQERRAEDYCLVVPVQPRTLPPKYLYPVWAGGVALFTGASWIQVVPPWRTLGKAGATVSYPLLPLGALVEVGAIAQIGLSRRHKSKALTTELVRLELLVNAYNEADAGWKNRLAPRRAQASPPAELLAEAALKFEALSTHAEYWHLSDKEFEALMLRDVALQALAAVLKGVNYVSQTFTLGKPPTLHALDSATSVTGVFAGLLHCRQAYFERRRAQQAKRVLRAVTAEIRPAPAPGAASVREKLRALDVAYREKRYAGARGPSREFVDLLSERGPLATDQLQALDKLMDAVHTTMAKTMDEALLAADALERHSMLRLTYGAGSAILAVALAALPWLKEKDDPAAELANDVLTATFATSALGWIAYCARQVWAGARAKASTLSEVPSAHDVEAIHAWLATPVQTLEQEFDQHAAGSRFFVSTLVVQYLALAPKREARPERDATADEAGDVVRTKFAIRLLSFLLGKTPSAIRALRIEARSADPAARVMAVAVVARSLLGQAGVEQRFARPHPGAVGPGVQAPLNAAP
ncbi:hypothetical protein [Pandoraea oxalativorans]|uniref:Uncharacterized protein n=1 Tax=Pandoraea oxalativorans TaxID=573737 RepID=A0A0G3IFV0_9BURK|nr:hypothetical protein [Pandoraea oxalativorans]AKK24776.1 hypothetical protein MB84_28690 [Pandoraea oxalativorans]